jgi:DNA-binding XRE family transcriptional regulator
LIDAGVADNRSVIIQPHQEKGQMVASTKSFDALLSEELLADLSFRAEWQRLTPARKFAAALLRYRATHDLSQRALAERLGVSQPRIVKLESGEHNPEIATIINAARKLEIEFCLDVSPSGRKPTLITARAQREDVIDHDQVSVVVASA